MQFHRALLCALTLAFTQSTANAFGEEHRSHIPREQVELMFSQMRANAPWDVDGPLTWGYFFTDSDRAALERASALLVQKGYRFVDIHLGEKQSPRDPDVWWLHVERVERHTIDSLDERNAALDEFAGAHHLSSYDGMDVGPAP